MIAKQKYKKDNYTTAPSSLSESKDELDFYLKWAEFIYSNYVRNNTLIDCDKKGIGFTELDLYAAGKQDPLKYKNAIDPADADGGRLMSINWDIEPILPRAIDKIQGIFSPLKANFILNSSDGFSVDLKKEIIAESRLLSNPEFKGLIQKVGVQPQNTKGQDFGSEEVLDLALELDDVKLDYEVGLETLIDGILDENNFDRGIKPDLIANMLKNYMAVLKCEHDLNGKITIRSIDPKFFISDYNESDDFRGVTYQGELRDMKIHELRKMGVDEVTLTKVAKKMGGINKHLSRGLRWDNFVGRNDVIHEISEFSIPVLEFYFVCDEAENYLLGVHKDGSECYEKLPTDYTEDDVFSLELENVSVETHIIQKSYKGFWVIDTKTVFKNEETETVLTGKVGNKRVRSPYVAIVSSDVSIVEGAIPAIDDYHTSLFKLKNAINEMAVDNMGIDLSLLEPTITMGGKTYDMLQLMERGKVTGKYIYKSRSEHGNLFGGSNRPPMHGMPDTTGMAFQRFQMGMVEAYNRFNEATGLTQIDKLEDPNERANAYDGEGNIQNNVLKNLLQKYNNLLSLFSKVLVDKILYLARNNYLDYNHPLLEDANLYCDNIGLNVEVIDSKKMEMELMTITEGKYQQGFLNEAAKFKVLNLIRDGRFRKAQVVLAIEVQKAKQEKRMADMENMKMQGQINERNAVTAGKVKQQEQQIKGQLELQKITKNLQADIEKIREKHKLEMERLNFIKENNLRESSHRGV